MHTSCSAEKYNPVIKGESIEANGLIKEEALQFDQHEAVDGRAEKKKLVAKPESTKGRSRYLVK